VGEEQRKQNEGGKIMEVFQNCRTGKTIRKSRTVLDEAHRSQNAAERDSSVVEGNNRSEGKKGNAESGAKGGARY